MPAKAPASRVNRTDVLPRRGEFYGAHGKMSYDVHGDAICHLCGVAWRSLGGHAWAGHHITAREYRMLVGLPACASLASRDYREFWVHEQKSRRRPPPKLSPEQRKEMACRAQATVQEEVARGVVFADPKYVPSGHAATTVCQYCGISIPRPPSQQGAGSVCSSCLPSHRVRLARTLHAEDRRRYREDPDYRARCIAHLKEIGAAQAANRRRPPRPCKMCATPVAYPKRVCSDTCLRASRAQSAAARRRHYTCLVASCAGKHLARGLCAKHLQQVKASIHRGDACPIRVDLPARNKR
jgi:hypothetical protein